MRTGYTSPDVSILSVRSPWHLVYAIVVCIFNCYIHCESDGKSPDYKTILADIFRKIAFAANFS